MNGRSPTVEEKRWMAAVADLGCIVCRLFYGLFTPCEIHHIDGSRKPGCHKKTIGLCPRHHRIPDGRGREWTSRHGDGKKAFERAYHSEEQLLIETERQIREGVAA